MGSKSDKNEVRKIQFAGRSTYILSLPKRWMSEMHLKAGDPVTIVRGVNNSLSIIPNAERRPNSANEVTVIVLQNESGTSLKRKVVSMYLAGYNIMHLKSKTGRISPSQRDSVREVVRRNLVGTEIIADASDLIIIQILLSIPELSVDSAVRRMFLISTAMHTNAMASLAEHNHELAATIIKSDDEVDRFSLYILRNLVIALEQNMLQEIGLKGMSDCLSYRVLVRSIERVADHAAGIANKCLKIDEKIPKQGFQKIDNMSRFSLMLLNDSVQAFLRRNYNLADNIVEKAKHVRVLENETIKLLEKVKTRNDQYQSISLNTKLILE
ncbi:MAG TPA: phosphate uptake regulator PhoU, partial [Candidatus Bathyarchaeia archaeon]|nr:phosphate uptake regulator PhoU [Candidatus Bathyarchaeia archaeon]